MRLDKYLAQSGVGRKKEVREYIKNSMVSVNDEIIIDPVVDVNEREDKIEYEEKRVYYRDEIYIMFNKPMGCVSARKDKEHRTVFQYFNDLDAGGLFHVGRLDKDTEGLLLFTNDGNFEHKLMHPDNHMNKRYSFWALGEIDNDKIEQIKKGVYINKGEVLTKPGRLKIIKSGIFSEFKEEIVSLIGSGGVKGKLMQPVVLGEITITEGKKHQVKKMVKAIGCHVIYLKREAIGEVELDKDLASGEYRELTQDEIKRFM